MNVPESPNLSLDEFSMKSGYDTAIRDSRRSRASPSTLGKRSEPRLRLSVPTRHRQAVFAKPLRMDSLFWKSE